MKRLFTIMAMFLTLGVATASAQIGGGQWILRGGFAGNNFKGDNYGTDCLPSYNLALDYNKTIKGNWYWNAGLMFGTRGFEINGWGTNSKFRAHNFNIPFTAGYKYNLTSNIAIDGRFGGFFGVDMAGKYGSVKINDLSGYKRCDGGIIIALGGWYKNINLEYMFKRGFAEIVDGGANGAVNHMLRVGYAF